MKGELLALFTAFAFGLASVAIAKGARTSRGESGVVLSVGMTAILSGAAWSIAGNSIPLAAPGHTIWIAVGWFIASGFLATVGGRLTLFKSIEFAGVVRASTVRRLMPFLSLVLAWVILDERIALPAGIGMALIAASFALLYLDNRPAFVESGGVDRTNTTVARGLAFGVLSAALYATSFIARKLGLADVPDPYFGALVGSVAALLGYAVGCLASGSFRTMVWHSLSRPNPWQLLAAFCMSVGQIAQFAAFLFADVARVAFITSIEIYVSAALAVLVFRTEAMPTRPVQIAMVLATGGVVLIAAGS